MRPSTAGTGPAPVDDPAARLLVKEAHRRMYMWPAGFSGCRAQVSGRITPMTERRVNRRVNTFEGCDSAPRRQAVFQPLLMTCHLDGQSVLGMESDVNDYSDVGGCGSCSAPCVIGEGGLVKATVIELSKHEVLQ